MTWSNAGGVRWRAMKAGASSDCSKGGNTATMSSTTASLIALAPRSMQPRRLEQPRPVDRGQHHVEGDALVVDRERHVDTGRAERPELSIKVRLAGDLFALDGEDDITGLELGARRRPLCGDADHHQLVLDFGRVHAEPGPRRLVDTTGFAQIVYQR